MCVFRENYSNVCEIDSVDKGKKGYVYLLGDWEKEGVFKIGVTRGTIENRIKKLQTGNGGEIYLVSYFQTEHPFFIEKWMHIKYYGSNVSSEWFKLGAEDIVKFKENCQKYEDLYKITHKKDENFDF